MGEDIRLKIEGRVGRITLARPEARNALTHDMCRAISAALTEWAADDRVAMLLIEGAGEAAFCAGGDLASLYRSGMAGDFETGRAFWREEYRMNAALFHFPKPVATFLHGHVLGGGIGVGCHASHRVVGETSRLGLPEVAIGLIPDAGGSLLLARAPGRLGEYLGLTATRMGPGDALLAEFADYYIPEKAWDALKAELVETGDWEALDRAASPAPEAPLAALRGEIDRAFSGETLRDILVDLDAADPGFAADCREKMARNSPLAMSVAVDLIHRVRQRDRIDFALETEYRFAARAMEKGDLLEGIRAAIIDRGTPARWKHDVPGAPAPVEVAGMLLPLGRDGLTLREAGA